MQKDLVQFGSLLAYAMSQLRSGCARESLQADLLGRGVAEEIADRIIEKACAENRRKGLLAGLKYLLIGLVCLTLGAVITGATYTSAVRTGGTYWITLGLFGFGVGYTLGGIVRLIAAGSKGR